MLPVREPDRITCRSRGMMSAFGEALAVTKLKKRS